MKRLQIDRQRRRWLAVLLLAGAACVFFVGVRGRTDALLQEGARRIVAGLSSGWDYRVEIGRVSGDGWGRIVIEDLRIREPWMPEGRDTLLRAERVELRYRFLDFLSKRFNSSLEVVVRHPVVSWNPRVSLRKPDFPFLRWFERWALSRRDKIRVRVENFVFLLHGDQIAFSEVHLEYDRDRLLARVPLRHLSLGGADVSTELQVDAKYWTGGGLQADRLTGQIRTEGTIINWKPLPSESAIDFEFGSEGIRLSSVQLVGGLTASGQVDFRNDYELELRLEAERYPLSNLEAFFSSLADPASPTKIDLRAEFRGAILAPHVEASARIYDGWIGRKAFKALDLHAEGVYPTVQLSGSKILLEDETTMRFADAVLEVRELFQGQTYRTLVSSAQQSVVVWGDWELSRPSDRDAPQELLMQRSLGDRAKLQVKKLYSDESLENQDEFGRQLQVGFEYQLLPKDSLKFEVRDDEEFVGVERKLKF